MVSTFMEKQSTSLVTKEIQVKTSINITVTARPAGAERTARGHGEGVGRGLPPPLQGE